MVNQKLFDYMANEHGVILLETDQAEIINCLKTRNTMEELENAKKLIENNYLMTDIGSLHAKDRLQFYLNLMEYFVPKRQRSSINENDNELPKDLY